MVMPNLPAAVKCATPTAVGKFETDEGRRRALGMICNSAPLYVSTFLVLLQSCIRDLVHIMLFKISKQMSRLIRLVKATMKIFHGVL